MPGAGFTRAGGLIAVGRAGLGVCLIGLAAITVGALGPFPPRPEPGSGFFTLGAGLVVALEAGLVVPAGGVLVIACAVGLGFSLGVGLATGGGGLPDTTGGVAGLAGGLGVTTTGLGGFAGGLTIT